MKAKRQQRDRRHARIRSRIKGTAERPRLSVYRSNSGLYIQAIDDDAQTTLFSVHSQTLGKNPTVETAQEAGKTFAKKARSSGIERMVFDRGGFIYHGRVKAVAEGVREGGITI